MRRVYLLMLVLAAIAAGTSLTGWATYAAGGAAIAPVETPQRAAAQQDCTADDDVSITVDGVYDFNNFNNNYILRNPPDYADGDSIWIGYTVTNASCHDITVTVSLTGSESGETIQIESSSADPCTTECTVLATGGTGTGWDQWDLGKHPNTTSEKVIATITVTAPAGFVDANPDNNSATSAQSINIVNEEPDPAPDIAVKSVKASKTTVVIGEAVDFTVVVKNDGDADAETDTTVTLHLGDGTDELDSYTVSLLADGPDKTVTLSWDTNGAKAGKHTLRVLAQTEGDGNADNDSETVTVTLLEPSVDIAVKSVTASVSEAVVGDTVDFTVTLENDGNVVAVKPEVALFDEDGAEEADPLASKKADISIAVGDTATVTVSWDTDEADAGEYSLRAVATVADDDDSSNDSATASLTLHDPVDVGVSLTDAIASSVVSGAAVEIGFTLANTGDHDAGEVKVSLYVTAEGEEREDAEPADTESVPDIAVGDSATRSFDWDTAAVAVGRYDLEMVIQTIGDTDETNNEVSHSIEIRNWLTLKSVSPPTAIAIVGEVVELTAKVENVGPEDLTDLTVGLFEAHANDPLASTTISNLPAGDDDDATIQWDTAGRSVGTVNLTVAAGADEQDPDQDDHQSLSVELRNPIALSSANVTSTDNFAGSTVTMDAIVRNESDTEITDVAVKLFVGNDEKASSTASIESITAGKTADVILAWDTAGVAAGKHDLEVIASMDNYSADDNDERSLTISLREPVMDVALTAANLNRSVAAVGQTLDVTATITNNGDVPVAVPVALYLEAENQGTTAASTATSPLIEPGSSEDVTLTWDSTGETVGTHMLRVSAELPEDTTDGDNEELLEVELFHSAFDGTEGVDECVEDVQVKVTGVRDLNGQQRSPPDYQVGEHLRLPYTIYNYSCAADVQVSIAMTHDDGDEEIDGGGALCFSACRIPYGGKAEGEVAWTIPTSPASDRPVSAALTVEGPDGFTSVKPANDTSDAPMNIVHPDDVVVRLGEQTGSKISVRRSLTGPEFGTVDVRLVSADPLQTAVPFAAATVQVAVAVANDGTTTEPTAIRFLRRNEDGIAEEELHNHTLIIPADQTKTESIEVPIGSLPPGGHRIEVELVSAATNVSSENAPRHLEITRQEPLVNVKMQDIAVSPDVLMLGDDATVSLMVRNNSDVPLALDLELYLDDEPQAPAKQSFGELPAAAQSEKEITWNLPASGKHLGQRVLKLALTSAEYGRVAETSRDITLHVSAEIVAISTSPRDTAMRGEKVAIEVEVRNNGPATANVPVTLRFPSATKDPEVRSPPVRPGETGIARFTWHTGDYPVGGHVLVAKVPDEHNIATDKKSMELPFRLTPLTITATIVDVYAYPEDPSVGEPVSIAVTVRNDGPVATRIPITLRFPPGGRKPDSRKPHLDPGETKTVVFEWLTGNHRPGTHRFRIEVAAAGNPVEHLNVELSPPVMNAAIVNVSTYPAETAMVGMPVEVWVDVRNDGPVAVRIPVQLAFPSDEKKPERDSERIGPGEIARYSFTWKTSNYEPGAHTLRAAIPLDDNVTVGDTSAELRFELTPPVINAAIVDIAVTPEPPRVGEPVTIAVNIRNDGTLAANIPVTLHFPASSKQPATKRPRVAPGETGSASFQWLTSRYEPDVHRFRLEVPSDPPTSRHFTIELLPPLVDVAIVGMGSDPADTAIRGRSVKIWVDVINNGPLALNVPIQLDFPSEDRQPERRSPRVEPGKIARVEFTWKTAEYEPGVHLLTATLLADNNITDLDTTSTIEVTLVPAQLMVSIVDISRSPEMPAVGDPVTITITVRNDGFLTARIPVTLHFPAADKHPETRSPRVAPGETGSASFQWRTSRYEPGMHEFRVEVPSDPPTSRHFTIELLPPLVDVAIVGMGSDPADTAIRGRSVKIWVDVINNGPLALHVPIQLSFPSEEKRPELKSPRVKPGETVRVEFTWKTANYAAGNHLLTATLLADNNITELDTTASIQIKLVSPQLIASIVDISWSPGSPVVGEPVRITVSVRNDGIVSANIPVTLYFPSGDKQPETRRPRVAPGAVGAAAFTWRTSRYEPGDHVFRVRIPGVAGAVRTFEIELRPPEVDFAVVDLQAPDPLHPIVKGDWLEMTVVVQNQGPYAGRGTVYLLNSADPDPMYEHSVSLEPSEIKDIQFTWKTLRYPIGEYDLSIRVEAEYDTDPDNDRSDLVPVHLLTNLDITVGFGDDALPDIFAGGMIEARLNLAPGYPNEIRFISDAIDPKLPTNDLTAPPTASLMGVEPKPLDGRHDPARLYWQWRSAQFSPWECARYQQTVGESLPRAVLCPGAPSMVR